VKTFWRSSGLARFAVLLGAFVLASGFVVAPQGPAYATTCALVGEGTQANPWKVGSRADFQLVARFDCLASGHYLQTAHLTGDQMLVNYNADRVSTRFTGVYDGDHYQIEFGGDGSGGWADPNNTTTAVVGLFSDIGGVVKKVRLTGSIHSHTGTASTAMGTLAQTLDGGLVSEVSSDVRFVKSAGSQRLDFGGLVASVRTTPSRIEYSSFTGSVEWEPTVVPVTTSLGGIVYRVSSSDFELRDSYASFSGTIVEEVSKTTNLRLGGLIDLTDTGGTVRIVRSYASPRVAVTGFGSVTRRGLIGSLGTGTRQFVSVFWQADLAPNAVTGTAPATYSSGLPVAVALTESQLQTITSYQTKEGPVAGEPGGDELVTAASTGALAEQDYRWAIEQGNVSVFIPSRYTTASDYLTRELYTDTSAVQTYQTRGVEATATGYPTLGRVWEICPEANGGFPVLVWQEFDCGSSGELSPPSSTPTSPSTDWTPTQPELAATGATPLGLLLGTALIAFGVLARRLASKAQQA
jgi:hypothetical protein